MWRVTADNGQFRCEGYRRGWFASLGFDFGVGGCQTKLSSNAHDGYGDDLWKASAS
jgi:hypothetical protein